MGRPKLDLFLIEQTADYQIHSNTELEGCRKVKQEEFECGGAKSRFLPKIDVFCKTILLAPPAMGRPKLAFHHAEKVLNHLTLCFSFFLGGVAGVGVSIEKIIFLFNFCFNYKLFRFWVCFLFGNTVLFFAL